MKSIAIALICFAVGCTLAVVDFIPSLFVETDYSIYSLYLLMFLAGTSIGSDRESIQILKKINLGFCLVPTSVVCGSLLGAGLAYLFIGKSFQEGMAVGAGFGYYSLSSIYISANHSESLGVIALLSNIFRELTTLIITPFLVRYVNPLSPVVCAGATSMDTALPVISKFSGKEYVLIALFSGICLTVLVPVILPFIL